MFNKVLIANRGEIAVRIIRACRELGIKTVAVCSEADREALHAQIADECICIGPANVTESYLNMQAILSACEISGAQAVHPGFGFLSENPEFAKMCAQCSISFIGPSYEVMSLMGDKIRAKEFMEKAGVPVVPGSIGEITSLSQAKKLANEIGYPVIVKASAGGGGKGIRVVREEKHLEGAIATAKKEALSFFGDDKIYIEKFIENPKHIEVQILADKHGNVIYLGERDCSVQRKNQKIIEECPSPSQRMTKKVRDKMAKVSVAAAKAAKYEGAGTIEYLVGDDGNFYFMEMNTRIQVEHGITELITGIDIVKNQITVAYGETLPFTQKDIHFTGHAIECRINAENPNENFRPCPGKITSLYVPGGPGIRIDSCVYAGYKIPPYYDSMIGKLMAFAPSRDEAIAKMKWALAEFIVSGIDTNIDYHLEILNDCEFLGGEYSIGFLESR